MRIARSAAAVLLACTWGSSAIAETIPAPGGMDSRMRTATYSADEVYRLEGRAGYQIDIEFERGEAFVGLGAGDVQGLSFVAQGNHLFLKPKAARVETNLTVLTSQRSYHFEYTAGIKTTDADGASIIYSLRFVYSPASDAAGGSAAKGIEGLLDAASAAAPRNVDYWYCGHPSLKPIEASDDGARTRLRFGARSELPALFVRNEDGSDSLLNFNVDGGDVVIHRVARRFIVRRGKLTGCIVNAGYRGSGERLESGTISPAVERKTREGRP